MRIAVINEVSASSKNPDILGALAKAAPDAQVQNVGMSAPDEKPELTYIQTGLIGASLLNAGATDFVIGGCGTGQGFLNSVMQYPNVVCGLIVEPLDAWLFSQINDGNCISLALNKGYGWAGDIQLEYIFDKLFGEASGQGYPTARACSQENSRGIMADISAKAHRSFADIVEALPASVLAPAGEQKPFMDLLRSTGTDLASYLYSKFSAAAKIAVPAS